VGESVDAHPNGKDEERDGGASGSESAAHGALQVFCLNCEKVPKIVAPAEDARLGTGGVEVYGLVGAVGEEAVHKGNGTSGDDDRTERSGVCHGHLERTLI
jgi:hypothetical protein